MSWAEVKKINDNMGISLDQLFTQFLAGGMREYIYETRNYTVPFDGVYTIRAFCGHDGSYGKLVRKCKKGEILTVTMTNNTVIEITSNLEGTAAFHINLAKDSYVNGNSANGIRGIAIGGAFLDTDGGSAYIRCNNGIAAGGGGSGFIAPNQSSTESGFNGGAAYAYGTNVYALGGGGGGGGSSNTSMGGLGGAAYINGVALTSYCGVTTLESGKGYDGTNGHGGGTYYGGQGGNGGCGGGAGDSRTRVNKASTDVWQVGGLGYFSHGGIREGGSARGGNWENNGVYCNSNASTAHVVINSNPQIGKGYFVGGSMGSHQNIKGEVFNGGIGGFLGGKGVSTNSNSLVGKGGYSPYGFGGNGGDINGLSNGIGADGGDGRIMGGNGGEGNGTAGHQGNGGNGYYPGSGYINGIAMTNNMLIGTAPLKGMTADTSIVIIEYGDSPEDF